MKKKNVFALLAAMALVGSVSSCDNSSSESLSTTPSDSSVASDSVSNSSSSTLSSSTSTTSNSTSSSEASSSSSIIDSSSSMPSESSSSVSIDSSSSSEEIVLPDPHHVNITGGEGAYVMVNSQEAIEGEAMQVTVVITDSKYALREVKLNDQALNTQVDENNDKVTFHGFLMPNEDVNIFVDTYIPTKDYLLSFAASDTVDIFNLADSANEGDVVFFKLRTLSGYAIDSVRAYATIDGEKQEIDVFNEDHGEYSIEMPAGNVEIVTESSGAYFRISANTEDVIFSTTYDDPEYNTNWTAADFVDAFLVGEDWQSSNYSKCEALLQAGSQCVFRAKRVGENSQDSSYSKRKRPDAVATHYYVDGLEVYPVDGYDDQYHSTTYYTYGFTMPNKNTEITVECVKRELSIQMDLPSQLEGRMYKLDSELNEITVNNGDKVNFGEKIYYTAKLKDEISADDYVLKSTYLSIPIYSSNNSTVIRDDITAIKEIAWDATTNNSYDFIKNEITNLKSFIVPNLYYVTNVITIKFNLKDLHAYENSELIGHYVGYEIYNSKKYGSLVSCDFNGAGIFASSTSYLRGDALTPHFEENYIEANLNGTKKNVYYYNDSFVTSYNSSYDNTSDCYFLIKADSTITQDDIVFKTYKGTSESGSTICVVAVYSATTDELLNALYLNSDSANTQMIPGVSITMTEGTYIDDEGAKFTVTREDVVYFTVE